MGIMWGHDTYPPGRHEAILPFGPCRDQSGKSHKIALSHLGHPVFSMAEVNLKVHTFDISGPNISICDSVSKGKISYHRLQIRGN